MDRPIVAVVMAGGTGTRLYPASRSTRPKQFLSLAGEQSLLSRTVDRCSFADEVVVSTNAELADSIPQHAPDADVLVEPAARDTGPALVYAAHWAREQYGDCVLVNLPSDHVVGDGFTRVARDAVTVAEKTDGLVTIGVEPDRPATGYGYIRPGTPFGNYFAVDTFREKPDRERAEWFLDRGFYWNSGMFVWTPDALLAAARDSLLDNFVDALDSSDPEAAFEAVAPISIDYAVMERTDDAYILPTDIDWDDLGSWDALERVFASDGDGNVTIGENLTIDSTGNVVASDDKHVSVIGLDDTVVAAFDDRVVVVPKSEAQRVREVVEKLESDGPGW